jgi:putative ABC transport system permease protein
MPEVKEISFCSENTPFSNNTDGDGIDYNGANVGADIFSVEDGYKNVLNMKILEGRWFEKQDAVAKHSPVLINVSLKERLFGNESPIDKLIAMDYDKKNKVRVIGIVQDAKVKGDYTIVTPAVYKRIDTSSFHWLGNIVIKVTPGADAAFEGRLYKTLANFMKDSNVEVEHLTNKRKNINYFALVPMIILSIVSCFLIINVAMGLFGVLWYNINKRRGEIGLRRAVGATGRSVSSQLVLEALVLTTFALIIGTFFAVQFPLLNVFDLQASVYIIALLLSIIFVYLLVTICALYPGKQAAAIYPAVALHEE